MLVIRKNIVTFTAEFFATDLSGTQPAAANVILTYTDLGGASHEANIPMVYSSATNEFSATWDSSAAGNCTVDYMMYGYGGLQAATQGCFEVTANAANNV